MVKRVESKSYNMSGYKWYIQMSCHSYNTEDFTLLSLLSVVTTTLNADCWDYCSELLFCCSLNKLNKFCLNCLLFIINYPTTFYYY